jgi:RecA-family ATPase
VANRNGGKMLDNKIELKMIKMSEVQAQEVEWLWYPFIPYGKLTIIQGDPGDGKTTMVLNLAAKLSKGEQMDEGMNITEPTTVIYQTAEDGLADTVKPRLELAGADCERIVVIDESDKSLSMVDERLEEAIQKTKAKLLILDPIQAYLGGGMDMNRANEARDMTKKLGTLAEKYKCAIVLIGHMNKASGNKAAYRGMGSIDFFAVARSVLLVGRVEGEPELRAVVQIKNNLAAFGHPKAFALSENGFRWVGDYDINADEVLGGIAPKANKLEQAKQMLRELAETTNAVQSSEVFEMADEQGISKRTMENAKKELGIRAKKINNSWYWELSKIQVH